MTALLGGPPVGPVAGRAAVARANPVAKVFVALVIPVVLVLTVDPVTAGVALLLECLALPWCGVAAAGLLRRGWIVLVGGVPAGVLTALVGTDSGPVLLGLGPVTVSRGSLLAGVAITLRVLAIGLPGVVLVATTDPTDLADGLAQVVRLPHRFVLSALAVLRLFGVVVEEWRTLAMARRARGLEGGLSVAGVRVGFGMVFALLVLTLRRATVLATTMEARGFGVGRERTWARPSRLVRTDWVLMAGGLLLAALATLAGILAGSWHLLLS